MKYYYERSQNNNLRADAIFAQASDIYWPWLVKVESNNILI